MKTLLKLLKKRMLNLMIYKNEYSLRSFKKPILLDVPIFDF